MSEDVILEANNLYRRFVIRRLRARKRVVHAVNGVDLQVKRGETLSIVGESGSGKTTLGRMLVGLIDPSEGSVKISGIDRATLGRRQRRKARRSIQMVFQDPYTSINPRKRIGKILEDPLRNFGIARGAAATHRVEEVLASVGLESDHFGRYVHEFSGGQRQRIGLARALIVRPDILICDEPVSALDVSVQAQIINLLRSVKDEFNLTYIFIAHDLAVVKYISTRVAVMYLGGFVEVAAKDQLFKHPMHPYTKALLSAIPVADPNVEIVRTRLEGEIPGPTLLPSGCVLHTRCPFVQEQCRVVVPKLREIGPGHEVACHFAEDLADK